MFFNKTAKQLEQAEEEILALQTELNQNKELLVQAQLALIERDKALLAAKAQSDDAEKAKQELVLKYGGIANTDQAIGDRQAQLAEKDATLRQLDDKYRAGLSVMAALEKKIALYEESLDLTEYGLYVQKYNFEFPQQYKVELESVYQRQKEMVAGETAASCHTTWTIGGSTAEGKRMVKNQTKLMLYAFNGECDAQIASIRWNNVAKIEERIRHAYVNINRLGATQQIALDPKYLDLKLQETSLNYEYQQRKNEEKEEQRRIRDQMREEEKAQRDFERAQKEAEDEERRFQKALEKAHQELLTNPNAADVEGLQQSVKDLEAKLQQAQQLKARAMSMAQQTKVGHIYIISNIGSFGEDIYKIGMTRRLDPHDRIRELSDASVPFFYDAHATIHSDNAPQLEHDLHLQFKDRRVNRVNLRKEFFNVSLDEIEAFVTKHTGATITFTKLAEAREYRETMALLEKLAAAVETPTPSSEFPQSLF
jgi:hypothetical protein